MCVTFLIIIFTVVVNIFISLSFMNTFLRVISCRNINFYRNKYIMNICNIWCINSINNLGYNIGIGIIICWVMKYINICCCNLRSIIILNGRNILRIICFNWMYLMMGCCSRINVRICNNVGINSCLSYKVWYNYNVRIFNRLTLYNTSLYINNT